MGAGKLPDVETFKRTTPETSRATLLAENRELREQLGRLVALQGAMLGILQELATRFLRPPLWRRVVRRCASAFTWLRFRAAA